MATRTAGGGSVLRGLHWEGHSGWSLGAAACFQRSTENSTGPDLLCEIAKLARMIAESWSCHKHAATDLLDDSTPIYYSVPSAVKARQMLLLLIPHRYRDQFR